MNDFDDALELYEQTFDDTFPMAMMSGYEPKEVIDIIEKCVKENKDVYDIGILDVKSIY